MMKAGTVLWGNLMLILFILGACQQQEKSETTFLESDSGSVADRVRKSNIIYDSASFQTGLMHVPPYVANGIIGGCFDHMGFQSRPNKGIPNGRTILGYIGQYYQHKPTTRQAQLPLSYIQAEFADGSTILNMMDTREYRQELDIYTGTLTTRYNLFGPTEITSFAHQSIPGLFVMKVDRTPTTKDKEIVLSIHCETSSSQNANIKWTADPVALQFNIKGNRAEIVSSTNLSQTSWTILTNNPIELQENTLKIRLGETENLLKIMVHRDDYDTTGVLEQSFDDLLASHQQEWTNYWERSWIDFPDARSHHIWNRANYYNLSNFPVVPEKALIPTGMNSNIWGFTFPQDVYYVAENLLRSGHFDRYTKSMKYWLDILPEVKKYSRRIMEVEGGFYPWTPPFAAWDEFEKKDVVGNDSYEIHNPAYVSAMVWHYYQRSGDLAFLKEYFPVMEEVWRFYSNVIHPNEKGTYDVNHHKAAGQDEASKLKSSKNLLCASYSAEYSARNYNTAAKLTGQGDPMLLNLAKNVLEAGLERNTLLKPEGYYATYEGDVRPANIQKHPVQLNAITFCPMSDLVPEGGPAYKAWQNRYNLTVQAKKPVSHGWTFAAFALASSRMGDPVSLAYDLSAAQYCAHADPRWIQFYEFTFWERYTLNTAYYFPTQGLYQQALTDALVQDWRGQVDLFACMLDEWKNDNFAFRGLYTLNGVSIDGEWNQGKFKITINPNDAGTLKINFPALTGELKIQGDQNGEFTNRAGEPVELRFQDNQQVVISNI